MTVRKLTDSTHTGRPYSQMGQVTNLGFGSCPRTTPRVTLAVNGVARIRGVRSQTRRRGATSSALDGRRGAVFLVAYVLAPLDGAAGVVGLPHRGVGYSARSIVTLKSPPWRSIASISPSNSPIRTMPLKNGASLS
jgi:hypothetical protein